MENAVSSAVRLTFRHQTEKGDLKNCQSHFQKSQSCFLVTSQAYGMFDGIFWDVLMRRFDCSPFLAWKRNTGIPLDFDHTQAVNYFLVSSFLGEFFFIYISAPLNWISPAHTLNQCVKFSKPVKFIICGNLMNRSCGGRVVRGALRAANERRFETHI